MSSRARFRNPQPFPATVCYILALVPQANALAMGLVADSFACVPGPCWPTPDNNYTTLAQEGFDCSQWQIDKPPRN